VVKKILATYKADGRPWERMNDWIDRIGWPAFFEKTGLPFTKYHIDNWRGGRSQPERFCSHPLLMCSRALRCPGVKCRIRYSELGIAK
jgi:hypothetical protein